LVLVFCWVYAMRRLHRYVFHIDVNSAFLSWSALKILRENPNALDLRTIPSAVGGDRESRHGIILARSTEAKKYGINTPEPIVQALKKCPNLVLVSPDMQWYSQCSKQLRDLLNNYTDQLIPFSIDEAWAVFEGYEEMYGDPVEFAYKLKEEIKNTLGFTVNIGVSTNFLLSKMAGDFSKPDKVHSCFPEEIEKKMWPLPVGDLLFCGKSTVDRLNRIGIRTIGDLAKAEGSILETVLKNQWSVLKGYANGMDIDLGDMEASRKSYSHSQTLSYDVTDAEDAKQILLSLTETLAARIRDDNMKAKCVSLHITTSEFKKLTRQKTLDRKTDITGEIYEVVCQIVDEMWTKDTCVRLLGVGATVSDEEDYYQISLFDNEERKKQMRCDSAMDSIRKRFGNGAIQRASLLDKNK